MAELDAEVPANRKLHFRIGIHVRRSLKEDGREYGTLCRRYGGILLYDRQGRPDGSSAAEKLFRQYADGGSHLGFEHLSQLARKELPGEAGEEKARQLIREGLSKGHFQLNADMGESEARRGNYTEARNGS